MSQQRTEYTFKPKAPAIISMTEADRDKLVADTRREALEEACKVVCEYCERGDKVSKSKARTWEDPTREIEYFVHAFSRADVVWCKASDIRKLKE